MVMKAVAKNPNRQKANTEGNNLYMLIPAAFMARISLSFDSLKNARTTAIITAIGITKIKKEGIQHASIRNMALALIPYWTIKSVMSRILAIKKTRVNNSRLRTNTGNFSI